MFQYTVIFFFAIDTIPFVSIVEKLHTNNCFLPYHGQPMAWQIQNCLIALWRSSVCIIINPLKKRNKGKLDADWRSIHQTRFIFFNWKPEHKYTNGFQLTNWLEFQILIGIRIILNDRKRRKKSKYKRNKTNDQWK